MKKNLKKKIMYIFFLIITINIAPKKIMADDLADLQQEVGFTYRVNHPENQYGVKGPLNLLMEPAQHQQVTISIKNHSERDIVIDLSLNGTRTNGSGGLEYGPNNFKADESLAYDITDLISLPEEISVGKKSEGDIVLDITMPEILLDGIVLGGLQMKERKDAAVQETSGTGVTNEIAYLIGVTLQTSEKEVEPDLTLDDVYPELANYRNAIFFDIANTKAVKLDDLMLSIEIMTKGRENVIYESKKINMSMAPNSLMEYAVNLDGEAMRAGNYTAHVYATSRDHVWKWNKDFTITREEADRFNQADVSLVQERELDWQLIVLIVVALVFVMACIYLARKLLHKRKVGKKCVKMKRSKKNGKTRLDHNYFCFPRHFLTDFSLRLWAIFFQIPHKA